MRRGRQRIGDLVRPAANVFRIAPVTRALLGHRARGEPLRVGGQPASKGRVSPRVDAAHEGADLSDRRGLTFDSAPAQGAPAEKPHSALPPPPPLLLPPPTP